MSVDASPIPTQPSPVPSLSPSRAADFKTCPLLFRFRTIDKIPEQPTADQLRGTLVHAVLERLFDLPAAERTPLAAAGLVAPAWQSLLEEEPALASLFTTAAPATAPASGTAASAAGSAVAPSAATLSVAAPSLAAQPSAAEPSAAGPSAARPSAAGLSAAGPSAAGPSAAGPSAAGPSA